MNSFLVMCIEICEKHKQVERVMMFGSRVVGDMSDASDIDLAVVCQGMNSLQWDDFVDMLEDITLLKLDIHRWDDMGKDFQQEVMRTGRCIYERTKD